jgi:sugar phosphate isomerase/epimerase
LTNLGFSTLGCSGAPLDTVLDLARSNDIGGLELRAADDEFTNIGLSATQRRDLKSRIDDAGLEILAINSYVHLCGIEDQPLDQHLELAADLGARGVRVFMRDDATDEAGTANSPTAGEFRAMDRITRAATDVRILLETHDSHSAGARMAAFCHLLDRDIPGHNAKVIWDSAHTWSHGETPAESLDLLKPWIDFIQIKDSDSAQNYKPVAIGTGDYPIGRLLQAVRDSDYWLSLEWELKWHPDLPPLTEALPATRNWIST